MLLQILTKKLKTEFPELNFSVDENNAIVTIPPKHPDVGSIVIEQDNDELIVGVGKFTHWHCGCYESELSEQEKALSIAEDISNFLADLFNDKIVMWGSHEEGGGFYTVNEPPNSTSSTDKQRIKWVWSGVLEK